MLKDKSPSVCTIFEKKAFEIFQMKIKSENFPPPQKNLFMRSFSSEKPVISSLRSAQTASSHF
jgi:hypothetical protein